MLFFSK